MNSESSGTAEPEYRSLAWYDLRLNNGSDAAWNELLTAEVSPLRKRARRIWLHPPLSEEDCEDLVQETLIKIWRRSSEIHGPASSYFALRNLILMDAGIDLYRKITGHRVVDLSGFQGSDDEMQEDKIPKLGVAPTFGDEAARRQVVDRGLRYLSEPDREILILHYREDLDTEDIAVLFGITVEAVKKRLQRARRRMADCLRQTGAWKKEANPA